MPHYVIVENSYLRREPYNSGVYASGVYHDKEEANKAYQDKIAFYKKNYDIVQIEDRFSCTTIMKTRQGRVLEIHLNVL